MRWARAVLVLSLLTGPAACAPRFDTPWGDAPTAPRLVEDGQSVEDGRSVDVESTGGFVTADGVRLPLRSWAPPADRRAGPRAVVLALHGFNDYSNAFADAGPWLAARGVAVYAYDQRGFGAGPRPGAWAGTAALVADADTAVGLLRDRYPGVPVYLLGESMGGAVAMAAIAGATDASGEASPPVDGTVLAAPAVWGRSTMPWAQRVLLDLAARLVPSLRLSGSGLGIWPSDNRNMLRALSRDPLVIKETRVDTLYGLTSLMDDAYRGGLRGGLHGPVLWLYGARDEIVPPAQTLAAARRLDPARHQRFVAYPRGYHMLLRDLQGETVLRDILAWIEDRDGPLPSGLTVDPARITIPGPPRRGARSPGVIEPKTR